MKKRKKDTVKPYSEDSASRDHDTELGRLIEDLLLEEGDEEALFDREAYEDRCQRCRFNRDLICRGSRSGKNENEERCRVRWTDKRGYSAVYYCEYIRFLGGVGYGMTLGEKVWRQRLFKDDKGGEKHE